MAIRKKQYKDMEKFNETRKKQKKRYYDKTATYEKREWSFDEDMLVLSRKITDTELSNIIGRSVRSIQIRRSRLRKMVE